MNEGSYFGFNDEFGSLQTVEWRAPGLTIFLDSQGVMTQPGNVGDMVKSQYAAGTGQSNTHKVDHAMYADSITSPLTFTVGSVTTQLSIDSVTGDLIVTSASGPNAGKKVNLTTGKWA